MELQLIDEWRHRIAKDESRGMRADVVVYASKGLIQQIIEDRSLEQP
jgi:hypothetical protein